MIILAFHLYNMPERERVKHGILNDTQVCKLGNIFDEFNMTANANKVKFCKENDNIHS